MMSNIVITSFAVSCRASSFNRFGELDQLCMRSDRRRETRQVIEEHAAVMQD